MRNLRYWRYSRQKNSKYLPLILIVMIASVFFALFWRGVNNCLRPALETMALSSAVNRLTAAMNAAVVDCVAKNDLSYQDFVTLTTDDLGQITSLTSDLASVSLLKKDIGEYVAGELEGLKEENFGVPLGTLTGWIIFSGKGPTVRVELLSVGDVRVQLRHNFSSAGINQTLHQIYLDLSCAIHLMIPGKILSERVETTVCAAETIVVGKVPDTYLYMGNGA